MSTSTTTTKKPGDQVETSLVHPNIDLEAQEKEKKAKGKKDGKDDKDDDKGGKETYEDWDPERKAHAEKVAKASGDLYKFLAENPSIEGMLSDRMTGVASAFSDPLYSLQELGVKFPEGFELPGARRMEKEKSQDWWGGEIPEQKEEKEKKDDKKDSEVKKHG